MHTPELNTLDIESIRALVACAVLAPSSHNTQPWRFQITADSVSLFADRTRALRVNDAQDRELTISCGCALMNLRIAAAHNGLSTAYAVTPDPGNEDLLAVVSLKKAAGTPLPEAGLFSAIEGRRTYRKPFESRDVPNALLTALADTAAEEGAWLHLFSSEEERRAVAALVADGDAIQWGDPRWRRELAGWMRPRRRGDGLGVPGIIAPIIRTAVRSFDMGKRVGKKDGALAATAPVLAVLGTANDGVKDWMNAGQALEQVLLKAQAAGLQASFLNQPVEVASLRPKLRQFLGRTGFPQILFRLGFPSEQIPAAPRRRPDEVIDKRVEHTIGSAGSKKPPGAS